MSEGKVMAFEAGDIVKLKSGGPLMTVEETGALDLTGEDAVWCVWFESVGNKQAAKRETFPPVVLEKAEWPAAVVRPTRSW